MEIGLAVGGAFLSSSLNVLFDRLAPRSDLLNMFQKRKNDVRLLNKLRMTLLGLQAVLTDAENKQASNQSVRLWLNELRDAVDSAENFIEEVNYEALRLKVEGLHQNLAETTSNQQVTDDFFVNIKDKLEDTIETLKDKAKCKGLPLALKTLAGMLRSKSEVEEWKCILRSELWKLPDNDILPALMLSYNDLPAHLKRCFSYCAIFPKDYPFRKEQVIHLWIANGLLPHEDEMIQDSGNQYFLELKSRSLFERVPNPSEETIDKFLMHDLVNDLAQLASSKLCIRLEESQGSHMLEQCRHLSYSMGEHGEFEKLKPLYELEQLRTLLPIVIGYSDQLSKRVLHNILPRLRSLRALALSFYRIKELPDDLFIKLKLLRFLDICQTEIKRLPDSICVLYNLETLLLSSCPVLEELPLQMEKLINLRHLDISNSPRLKIPLHLSKLKSLQVLVGAKFLVFGSRMEDMGEAQNLYGSLSVLELQNVVDRKEAVKAKMTEKNHVDKLSLEWSESIADNSQTERDYFIF